MTVTALAAILCLQTLQAVSAIDPTLLTGDAEVTITASETRFIAARWPETVIRGRPWVPHRRMATIERGTRLAVRGEVASRDDAGCHGKTWYAVLPFGFVCSEHARPTDDPPDTRSALPVRAGSRLPHAYALVRDDGAPSYENADMALAGIPGRTLTKGMSLVVDRTIELGGLAYVQTRDGSLVPKHAVGWMGQGSDFRGIVLALAAPQPGPLLAWVTRKKAKVFATPSDQAEVVATLAERTRFPILAAQGEYRQVGERGWVHADDLAELVVREPPTGVLTETRRRGSGNDQWVDVDVGEQVLVAYRGHTPVYATMISSGRGSPTPLGNYPVWAKVANMDMANQEYEDKPYMVQGVPWVMLFQGHNALHGAYWHNRFGHRKSHGCVNLAPLDARFVFEWLGPDMPKGWTGYLPLDLDQSPVVHVHDTSKDPAFAFTQERPWGPPDAAEEREKAEAAEERRAMLAAEEAALPVLDDLMDLEPREPEPLRPLFARPPSSTRAPELMEPAESTARSADRQLR